MIASPHILIVVNETAFMQGAQALVASSYQGAHVAAVASSDEALERIRMTDYDAILCDNDMRGMSGIDLVRQTSDLQPAPAIILMTENDTLLSQAFESGAYACLRKPMDYDLLITVLKRAVEFHNLERRATKFRQVMAFQARLNGYDAMLYQRSQSGERTEDTRTKELDELIRSRLSACSDPT